MHTIANIVLALGLLISCASNRKGDFAFHPDDKYQKYNKVNVAFCTKQAKELLKINNHIIPDLRDFVLSRVTDYEILTQRYPRPKDFYKGYDAKFPFPRDVLYQFDGGWQGLIDGVAQREITLSLGWDSQVFLYEEDGSLLPGANFVDHYGRICQIRKTKKGETLVFEGQYFPEREGHPAYLKWIGHDKSIFQTKVDLDKYELRFDLSDDTTMRVDKIMLFEHWKM